LYGEKWRGFLAFLLSVLGEVTAKEGHSRREEER